MNYFCSTHWRLHDVRSHSRVHFYSSTACLQYPLLFGLIASIDWGQPKGTQFGHMVWHWVEEATMCAVWRGEVKFHQSFWFFRGLYGSSYCSSSIHHHFNAQTYWRANLFCAIETLRTLTLTFEHGQRLHPASAAGAEASAFSSGQTWWKESTVQAPNCEACRRGEFALHNLWQAFQQQVGDGKVEMCSRLFHNLV